MKALEATRTPRITPLGGVERGSQNPIICERKEPREENFSIYAREDATIE